MPLKSFSNSDKLIETGRMQEHFEKSGIPFTIVEDFKQLKRTFKPDLIFFTQPYKHLYDDKNAEWTKNRELLQAIVPYSGPLSLNYINMTMHNTAWRYYIPSEIHLDLARRYTDNRGRNTFVSGDLQQSRLTSPADYDPWKTIGDGKKRKRIIWAPHYSIVSNHLFNRPDFLWVADVMKEIATQYADTIQIAFKPHPRLRGELCRHPEWGEAKTTRFYDFWQNSMNTQLETGDYLDLFKTSDAMIHNSGSFTCEYIWMDKPAGYTTENIESICAGLNPYAIACQNCHQTLSTPDDIRSFIQHTVLNGIDPMAGKRKDIIENILEVSSGISPAQFICNDLVAAFFK